jgi:CDP-4-dehydro-6-deoxyglucose reductase, E1
MKWPLMHNNITNDDADSLIKFLSIRPLPVLTNGAMVREFEKEWSKWLGVKYSVFVNSGSSANIITLAVLSELSPTKREVIVSPLNWVSDISAILHAGLTPVFCDINFKTLALDEDKLIAKITNNTCGVLLTHILGYNGLTDKILNVIKEKNITLIEDVCESHGATYNGQKVGTFGTVSNFSFYYAHHMTSIEGGVISTNDEILYNKYRMFRSHGMLREVDDVTYKKSMITALPDLNPDFIFMSDAYNMRSTELNAVLALNQLPRLDKNNTIRNNNLNTFLNNLNSDKYYTEFNREGNSNYALTLLLKHSDLSLRDKVETMLISETIEFRRGMSGGGNQLRQPYLIKRVGSDFHKNFPNCDKIHFFGWYIGNYPELTTDKILYLCELLNKL